MTDAIEKPSAMQSLQHDMRTAMKLLDRLVLVADKQVELTHELSRHRENLDRAFDEMRTAKSDLSRSIDGLAAVFKEDRERAASVAETLTSYKAGLRTLMMIGGAVITLLAVIGTMFANNAGREHERATTDIAKLETSMDAVRQQVIEVRMARERDVEARGK